MTDQIPEGQMLKPESVTQPKPQPEKPLEAPLGQPEQAIVARIDQDGDEDKVLQDIATANPELDIVKNYPLPAEIRSDKQLGEPERKILQDQWNLFNKLKLVNHSPNPIVERQNKGDSVLTKGTLVHGAHFDIETLRKIKDIGIISGELAGIPEDSETNYCADFFKVPEDMSVQDYLKWCQEIQAEAGSALRKKRPEFNYLPTPGKRNKQLAFIVDSSDPNLKPLLEHDAYNPDMQEVMGNIITQLPIPLGSPTAERMSAILCGTPSNFIDAIILDDGLTPDEINSIGEIMGGSVILYNTAGEPIETKSETVSKNTSQQADSDHFTENSMPIPFRLTANFSKSQG